MKKLNNQLEKIKQEKRLALMTHVIVGYPTLQQTIKIVKQMEKSGVDIIELQIPFSDPLADGPTIMKACEQSLANGTTVKDAFKITAQLSKEISIPMIFMAYFNTVFQYGTEKFCKDAKNAGISGLIVPDVPLEEEINEHFISLCDKFNLANIRVLSQTATDERLKKNAIVANGFVYITARQGITGIRDTIDPEITEFLRRVRKYFSIPLAVGFGISKREHLQILKPYTDIVIIGSAIIDVINKSKDSEIEENIKNFIKGIKI